MTPPIVEFTARGSARAVSAAIEAHASERRIVTALVVPWESDATTLRMALTSTKSDGWAIEHTNLGTISLTDLGGERTRIAVVAAVVGKDDHASSRGLELQEEQRRLLTAFANQLQRKFGAPSVETAAPVETAATEPPSERTER